MARIEDRVAENVEGEFFVDRSCIDCAVCRVVAPESFASAATTSIVFRQPRDEREQLRAKMALVACPTSAIGAVSKPSLDDAIAAFPEPLGDDVYFCGFASESSYGAQSYLIVRPEGNVLVDSPRATPHLLERISALGGVRWMFLTHRDDVADHAKFARHFGCERILHEADITSDTASVERRLVGAAPIELAADLVAIPVPGHTRGSTALLFRDHALFTGDHLFAPTPADAASQRPALFISRSVCWDSWPDQKRSLEKLLDFDFAWVLPGHEGRLRAGSVAEMRDHVRAALTRANASR